MNKAEQFYKTMWNPLYKGTSHPQFSYKDMIEFAEEYKSDALKKIESSQVIKESYLPVAWKDGHALIDGATAYNTMVEALSFVDTLPKIKGFEYTIATIRNSP